MPGEKRLRASTGLVTGEVLGPRAGPGERAHRLRASVEARDGAPGRDRQRRAASPDGVRAGRRRASGGL